MIGVPRAGSLQSRNRIDSWGHHCQQYYCSIFITSSQPDQIAFMPQTCYLWSNYSLDCRMQWQLTCCLYQSFSSILFKNLSAHCLARTRTTWANTTCGQSIRKIIFVKFVEAKTMMYLSYQIYIRIAATRGSKWIWLFNNKDVFSI